MNNHKLDFSKEYRNWILITLIGIALYFNFVSEISFGNNSKKQTYLQSELDSIGSQVDTTLKTYELFSNYIFEQVVNKPEVLN